MKTWHYCFFIFRFFGLLFKTWRRHRQHLISLFMTESRQVDTASGTEVAEQFSPHRCCVARIHTVCVFRGKNHSDVKSSSFSGLAVNCSCVLALSGWRLDIFRGQKCDFVTRNISFALITVLLSYFGLSVWLHGLADAVQPLTPLRGAGIGGM